MKQTEVVHAQSLAASDYTLCGLAPEEKQDEDTIQYDDSVGLHKTADGGDKITCASCLAIIAYCRSFKSNKQPYSVVFPRLS